MPGLVDPNEIELKLEVAPGSLAAIKAVPELRGLRARTRRQTAIYFDTPDQDLRAAGLSLRIRRADGKRVQTMKAEAPGGAGLFARAEWERPVTADRPQIDDAADGPMALLAGKPLDALGPTFTAKVARTIWEVTFAGARIELVFDEGAVTLGKSHDPVSELELELKEGDEAALFAFARAIAERVPVRLGVLTKSERGYRLLDGRADRAVKAAPVMLTRDMDAAAAFQAIARACLRQYRLNETLLLATRGAQPLHQARVALRRLRSALALFRPMLRDDRFDAIRAALRALAGLLGEARNLDVLIGRAEGTPLAEQLRPARERAYDAVCESLSAPETRLLMLTIAEWIAVGEWRSVEETTALRERGATRFATRLLQRYRKRLKKDGKRLTKMDDEGRHEVRILAKKLRYAAEFFGPLYATKPARRRRSKFLAALETLQTELGTLNDQATGLDVLRELGLQDAAAHAGLTMAADKDLVLANAADAYDELIDTKRFWR